MRKIVFKVFSLFPHRNWVGCFVHYNMPHFLWRTASDWFIHHSSSFIAKGMPEFLHPFIKKKNSTRQIHVLTKRRRYDPVLWQKPLHQQKCQKGKVTTQTTPQKSSIKQRLRTDLGRSVGVTTASQLVWFTRFTGPSCNVNILWTSAIPWYIHVLSN